MAGDYNGDGVEDAAIGVPRGNNLTGMVSLMNARLGFIRNITGTQVGSYFGASVATEDLDGDGLTDLVCCCLPSARRRNSSRSPGFNSLTMPSFLMTHVFWAGKQPSVLLFQ